MLGFFFLFLLLIREESREERRKRGRDEGKEQLLNQALHRVLFQTHLDPPGINFLNREILSSEEKRSCTGLLLTEHLF